MKKANSKKYVITAVVCAIIIVLLYTSISLIYMSSVINRQENTCREQLEEYAKVIKGVNIETVKSLTTNHNAADIYGELVSPNIDIVLYEKRLDNTAKYNTIDSFLNANRVGLTGKLNVANFEEIRDTKFMTYEFNHSKNYYVKLVMPYIDVTKNYIDYGIALTVFVVLAAVVCVIDIVSHNKMVFDNVGRQRAFMNDMSHEIRTPLTVIKGNLENILASPDSTVMDVSDNIESSLSEVDHLTQLSQNLLNIVSDTRTAVTKKMTYNISDTISGVLDIYSDIVSGSNKTLIANIDSINAVVDTEKIKQLVIILLDNAIKYTREGDKIRVQLKRKDNGFELIVADTGIGIADDDRDKIFDRFYRGANAKSENGTGLGLSIAKSIVEGHDGKIVATHNIPSGLVITVFIPSKS